MRADRLLSLMLLLQAKGKLKARDLAGRLQVSERTVHRDIDALSAAGVPVYAQRGPSGGVALLGDWRTNLTGLTEREAQALAIVGVPGALSDIGLSESLRSSLIKLAASLPAVQQQAGEHTTRTLAHRHQLVVRRQRDGAASGGAARRRLAGPQSAPALSQLRRQGQPARRRPLRPRHRRRRAAKGTEARR